MILPNVSLCVNENEVHYNHYVAPIRVTGVSLNKNVLELNTEATETLVATVVPNDADDKSVTWSSSDSNIATVSQGGVVSAVSSGNCTITVTTTDGGFTAQCSTTVTSPTPTGHSYVEIGGVKWATMNVGASSETDYGNYYQYGKGAAQYAATSGQSEYTGAENPLAATADTATQEWGGSWRMPTKAEFESLTANTNYTWETNFNGSGVNGGKFTDKTDSSKYIFIPAAGYYNDGSKSRVGSYGYVWSSSPNGSFNAYRLYFIISDETVDYNRRFGGTLCVLFLVNEPNYEFVSTQLTLYGINLPNQLISKTTLNYYKPYKRASFYGALFYLD